MQKRFMFVSILLFLLIMTTACSNNGNTEQDSNIELTISAAASLKDSMDVIQQNYEEEHPKTRLRFNFGGSGSLQQQISQGAPVDLFLSAAEDKFDGLVEDGMIANEDGVVLLENELVLVVPKETQFIQSFGDLAKAEVGRISIGTPETVPAGKYAKESLEQMDIWQSVESKVVYAKDVRQVLSYVETGNVDAGIVYRTDALISENVKVVTSADTKTHTPIIYPLGIIKDSKDFEAAKDFYDYLQSEKSIKVFEEFGFTTR